MVMLGEGGEKKFGTNINFLLEECGIMVNNDAVVRTNFYKYFHPKAKCTVWEKCSHHFIPSAISDKTLCLK